MSKEIFISEKQLLWEVFEQVLFGKIRAIVMPTILLS